MQFPIREALRSASRYVVRNPLTLARLARHATRSQMAIPLDLLRWGVTHLLVGDGAPRDVEIFATPPSLGFAATVDFMKNDMRTSATIRIESVRLGPGLVELAIRVSDLQIKPLGDGNSNFAKLLKSGALDLKKPGNLLKFFPKKPKALVQAEDDRFVIDLMREPKIQASKGLAKTLDAVTPVLNVTAIETDGDMLVLDLKATPRGVLQTIEALRN
jgi:hypothetical protein